MHGCLEMKYLKLNLTCINQNHLAKPVFGSELNVKLTIYGITLILQYIRKELYELMHGERIVLAHDTYDYGPV